MQIPEMQKLEFENERLQKQIDVLTEQVSRLILSKNTVKIEPISVVFNKPTPIITTIQTPAGYAKVGDIVCYDRCNKLARFGTVDKLDGDNGIFLRHRYSVRFGGDGKQVVYGSMDAWIEAYRVSDIL